MKDLSRREFLTLAAQLTAIMGLQSTALPTVVQALEEMAAGAAPVVWLQAQSCSGCSVSLLNSDTPGVAEVITRYISLVFHGTLSAATGEVAMDTIKHAVSQGGYFLAVEGSVPAKMPGACRIGEREFAPQLLEAAKKAKAVIAVGACAAHGGIPAADGNPTGAQSVPAFLKANNVSTPVISIPGCPTHPDWLVGTIVHVLKFGIPKMDSDGRPLMFFSKTVHEQCVRFRDYEREFFARDFGEDGCYFKLGCAGPITNADCPVRLWNSGTNWCIKAGAPCIGCASEHFAMKTDFPLYTKKHAQSGGE